MAQSMTNWLQGVVNRELKEAFFWTLDRNESFSNGRFTQEDQTLRIVVDVSRLPGQSLVQLRNVEKLEHAASTESSAPSSLGQQRLKVVVSDGTAEAHASLNLAAYETLSAEVGEITPDTLGDVFSVKSMDIVVRSAENEPGSIELEINALTYNYHLRRLQGTPVPIEQNSSISRVTSLMREYGLRPSQHDTAMSETRSAIGSQISTAVQVKVEEEANRDEPVPAILAAPSSTRSPLDIDDGSMAFLTQVRQLAPTNRPFGPQLDTEGFEMMNGVNVDGPVRVNAQLYTRPDTPQATKNKVQLLSLLNQNKRIIGEMGPANPRAVAEHVMVSPEKVRHEPSDVVNPDLREQSGPPIELDDTTNSTGSEQYNILEEDRPDAQTGNVTFGMLDDALHPVVSERLDATKEHRSFEDDEDVQHSVTDDTNLLENSDRPQTQLSSSARPETSALDVHSHATQRLARDYGRRKLKPNDKQRELLEKKSAWRPVPPGTNISGPNVPLDLLKLVKQRPNEQLMPEVDQKEDSDDADADVNADAEVDASTEVNADVEVSADADATSTTSESGQSGENSDGGIDWSVSPPRQPLMPPDSVSPVSVKTPTSRQATKGPRPAPAESLTNSSPPSTKDMEGRYDRRRPSHTPVPASRPSRSASIEHHEARHQATPVLSSPVVKPDMASPNRFKRALFSPRQFEAPLSPRSPSAQRFTQFTGLDASSSAPPTRSKAPIRKTSSASLVSNGRKALTGTHSPSVSRPPSVSHSPSTSQSTYVPRSVGKDRIANTSPAQPRTVVHATPRSSSSAKFATPTGPHLPDPNAVYHAARSAKLGEAQRYNWLRQNYTISREQCDTPDLKLAYRNAYPRDQFGAEFVLRDALSVFPELNDPEAGFSLHAVEFDTPPAATTATPERMLERRCAARSSTSRQRPPPRRPPSPPFDRHDTLGPFAKAYRTSRPGGFLHSRLPSRRHLSDSTYRVDVLSWKI